MNESNRKLIAVFLLAALMLALLSGCGKSYTPKDLVQDTLDLYFKDKTSDAFMEQMGINETEANERFENWLALELPFFCELFEIELDKCDDTIRPQLVELYKDIYSHSKYSVGDVTENEGNYSVAVKIEPIDVLVRTYNDDLDIFITELSNKINAGEYASFTDTEFETVWAQGIIDLVRNNIPHIGYLEAQTVTIRVEKDADGVYSINEDDFSQADALIIAY